MSDATPALRGRHALVTGGGRGIGAAIAEALVSAGADVTITGRTLATLQATSDRLSGRGPAVQARVCDVRSPTDVRVTVEASSAALGPIGILVNNAGWSEAALVHEIALGVWEEILAVNLTGTFLFMREVLPRMIDARAGRIVNVASTAGLEGHARVGAYTAAKHGVIGLTRTAAIEAARHGITVNAVCPGYVDGTDMFASAVTNVMRAKSLDEAGARALLARHSPGGALVTPADVARDVVRLCGPWGDAVNGRALIVQGGGGGIEEDHP